MAQTPEDIAYAEEHPAPFPDEPDMRHIHTYPSGYRVRFASDLSKYFSFRAYGSPDIAKIAAGL